jgi:hypothetical protein
MQQEHQQWILLYVDDIWIMFLRMMASDITLIKQIIDTFVHASGIIANILES